MPDRAHRIQELRRHKLSRNLSLYEAVRSDTAERDLTLLNIQLEPPDDVIDRLTYVAKTVFQPLRDFFGVPITCNSGWRSRELNRQVGGAAASQHVVGEALDLSIKGKIPDYPRRKVREAIQEATGRTVRREVSSDFYLFARICLEIDALDIDQVIHEYGAWYGQPAWVHVAASGNKSKREMLAARQYDRPKWERGMELSRALAYGTDEHPPPGV